VAKLEKGHIMTDRLTADQKLNVNDQISPPNGMSRLIMQSDGNLVLYNNRNGQALWASNTYNTPVNVAIMQGDGNFVCYDPSGKAYWSTGSWNHPGSYVVLQDDGNLAVIGPDGSTLWATNTQMNTDPMSFDTGEANASGHGGFWMHSWASMADNGLISGQTRTWSTLPFEGFHGSVLPLVLDANGKTIWPSDPDSQKHTYGVDGTDVPFKTHDETEPWANTVDSATLANAKAIQLLDYYDPHNQLLNDLGILGQTATEVIGVIQAAAG
jgi:hypothetical protein